jgi:acetylornithine deacetylase
VAEPSRHVDAVLARVARRSKDLLDFAAELVATPSPNPPGDERAVADVITRRARDLGLEPPEALADRPERPNLVFRLRGGAPGPSLMLTGHTDTKPVGPDARWTSDPLTPTIRDGRLYGLGSTDMKGAVAAMLFAFAALQPEAAHLSGDLLLVLTADEEMGSRFGAHYLADERLVRADAALVGEPCGITHEWEAIDVVGRGVTAFRVIVRGTQMHSSCSDILPSVNASVKLAEVLAGLESSLHLDHRPHPLCPQGITVNAGVTLGGGVTYGVYPGYACFGVDVRTLPGMSRARVARDLDSWLEGLRERDPRLQVDWEFAAPPIDWIEPTEIAADHPLVVATAAAAQRVLGRTPPLGAFPGATDATPLQHKLGIPCIAAFGPGLLPLAHGPDEYVPVESVVQAAGIYALTAMGYLGEKPSP